ncbi:unnamed protein product [Closterium sp. NIES-53]
MTSLRRSGGSGDSGGGSSGSGGGRTSSHCGAVWWGVSGGGQMQLQQSQRESLPPQQLLSGGGLVQLQRRPRKTLMPQQLREWYAQRGAFRSSARCPYVIRTGARDGQTSGTAGDTRAGGVGVTRLGGAGVTAGAGGTRGAAAAGPGGARTRGTGANRTGSVGGAGAGDSTEPGAAGARGRGDGGTGTGGTGAGGAGAVGTGDRGTSAGGAGAGGISAGGAGAGGARAVDPRAGGVGAGGAVSGGTGAGGTQPLLQPASALSAPSPYTEQAGGLTERREPASCPASPVRTGRRVPRPRPPPVPGTHAMVLRPSSVPLRVPLPPPPESSLPAVPDPESDRARATSPIVSCLLATIVTDPSFESSAASALVAELVDFAATYRLDYATTLVAEYASASPPSVGDAPDIPTPCSYAEVITGPFSSQWQAAMDAEMASWKSTGTYVDAVPPSRANIVDGMWIFRVKRPSGSPPAFKARYVARGFSQRQGVENG